MKTKEKAKAYDEAVEQAKKELNTCSSLDCDAARQIFRFFPQLRESEDERIRKGLIEALKVSRTVGELKFVIPYPERKECIAYLEKLKEQKPAKGKEYYSPECGTTAGVWSDEEYGRLFDIEHYLDGTLQLSPNRRIACIDFLKSIRPKPKQEWREEDERILKGIIGLVDHNQHYNVSNKEMLAWLKSLHPQLKQEWSKEDKDVIDEAAELALGWGCPNLSAKLKSILSRVKPVEWSEEDEKMRNLAIEWAETMSSQFSFVDMDSTDFRKIIKWLKSFRSQPKEDWGEEDKQILHSFEVICQRLIENPHGEKFEVERSYAKKMLSWLKSLRPSWKPSEEQMEALETAKRWYSDNMGCSRELESLYEHLKKLM